MMHYLKHLLFLCIVIFCACNDEDKKAPAPQAPTTLYLDYQVSAEEGAENAIVLLQFREGEAEDAAVALEDGSMVTFDGEPVEADSAKLAGVFYEVQRPLASFAGEHTITFKDQSGQVYEERFTFDPLRLASIEPVVSRNNLVLTVEGIQDNSNVQVTVTDTSFRTADINDDFKVKEGQIMLGEVPAQKLASGPINLELHREEVKPLANGRLLITYAVRRELVLKD